MCFSICFAWLECLLEFKFFFFLALVFFSRRFWVYKSLPCCLSWKYLVDRWCTGGTSFWESLEDQGRPRSSEIIKLVC